MKRNSFIALACLGLVALACTAGAGTAGSAPASGAPASPINRDDPRVFIPEDQQAAKCQPGREHWRSQAAPIRGGIIHGSQSAPNLDVINGTANGLRVLRGVYESPLRMRLCFGEDLGVLPGLVKSWDVSPDGLTWTMKIQDGVKWHNKPPVNGRPFTSADIGWNIDYQLQGGALKSFWEGITHEEPDASTIVLHMKEPHPDFLLQLAYRTNVMAAHEVVDQGLDFKQVAIGTGPFMVDEFRPGQSMKLVRNPEYYEIGTDGKPLPYLEGVQEEALPDQSAINAALRAGQLEYGTALTVQDLAEFQRSLADRFRTLTPTATLVYSVWFNPTHKPWDDPRLRRAVSMAINREDVIQGGRGGAAVQSGFMPIVFPYAWSLDTVKQKFRQDTEGAKQLLMEAGYQPGQLQMPIVTTRNYTPDTEVIVEQLKAAGINASIDIEETGAGGSSTTVLLAKGDFSVLYGPTPTAFFPDFYMHTIVNSGSTQDYIRLHDPEIDRLSSAQHVENDPAKRRTLLDQLQERLLQTGAYAPVLNPINLQLESCKLQNFKPWGSNHFLLEGVREGWLDPNGKC